METLEKKGKGSALLPFLLFIVIYLGAGLYFQAQGVEMAFYQFPSVTAMFIALLLAFCRARHHRSEIHSLRQGRRQRERPDHADDLHPGRRLLHRGQCHGRRGRIIFTAGVGENGPDTRANVVSGLEYMGVKLDAEKNNTRGKEVDVATDDSKVRVLVIPTNEELMIAMDTAAIVKADF